MKPSNKYRLPGDPIAADDLPWWHELIRLTIFLAAIGALTFAMFGAGR